VRKAALAGPACRVCGSPDVRRSERRSFLDGLLSCLFLVPLRCRHCRARFYRFWRPAPKEPLEPSPDQPRAPLIVMPPRQFPPVELDYGVPERPRRRIVDATPVLPSPAAPPPVIIVEPVRFTAGGAILILESDLSIRKLLRRLLERRGHFTREIEHAADLASELRERRVDLLIVDPVLLGPNGMDAAFAFTRPYPNLKILALSLESRPGSAIPDRCLTLTKPFSLDTFVESVDRLLIPK
jgi:CheY-like chemotaxis protein